MVKVEDGILFINPGSPTRPMLSKPSVGVLRISKGKIEAEIVIIEKE
jgi:predicted phosphodiesterase